jgi:hypothetical protein
MYARLERREDRPVATEMCFTSNDDGPGWIIVDWRLSRMGPRPVRAVTTHGPGGQGGHATPTQKYVPRPVLRR